MKNKLLFVATTPFAANAFLRTHLLALAENYEVTLCVNTLAYPLSTDLKNKIQIEHIDIERKISPLRDLQALYQLYRCFRRIRPDIVHSITPKAGLLGMLAGYLVGIPHRFHTFTGQVWATKSGLAKTILKTFDRLIARFTTQVLADSASQCRLLENERVVEAGKVSVLGPGSIAGVDIERFCPNQETRSVERNKADTSPAKLVFLFVGRLVKDKGIFDLLDAYITMSAHYPQTELWIVGPDEEGLLAELQARAAASPGRIRWCGGTSHPERYMAAADVLVLPSYREGFGSVVIEAAACAIPALAYRIDGIVDAVVEHETGLLAPLHDIEAFASEMSHLCDDRQLLYRLGKQAYDRATQSFRSTAVTAAWAEFYRIKLFPE